MENRTIYPAQIGARLELEQRQKLLEIAANIGKRGSISHGLRWLIDRADVVIDQGNGEIKNEIAR
jgi:hypothetical protein